MNATLDQVKTLVDDVKVKSDTIIEKLIEAKASLNATQAKLDLALASADDPAAVQAIKDELQGVDDSLTSALSTASPVIEPPTT